MLLSWSLPRVFVATPVWRVRTDFSLTPAKSRPAMPRPAIQPPKAKAISGAAPAAFDRSTARALVDAGYMPLSRYVELFEAAEPQFGEGEV
jgi:hypothetical protein